MPGYCVPRHETQEVRSHVLYWVRGGFVSEVSGMTALIRNESVVLHGFLMIEGNDLHLFLRFSAS